MQKKNNNTPSNLLLHTPTPKQVYYISSGNRPSGRRRRGRQGGRGHEGTGVAGQRRKGEEGGGQHAHVFEMGVARWRGLCVVLCGVMWVVSGGSLEWLYRDG